MPPSSRVEPTLEDSLEKIATQVGSLLTLPEAADPQKQQLIQALQGALVGLVHQLRAHKAQSAAQGPPQGAQMAAGPGQQGYGAPPSAGGASAPGGGSPDEMARVLGPVGAGNVQ